MLITVNKVVVGPTPTPGLRPSPGPTDTTSSGPSDTSSPGATNPVVSVQPSPGATNPATTVLPSPGSTGIVTSKPQVKGDVNGDGRLSDVIIHLRAALLIINL